MNTNSYPVRHVSAKEFKQAFIKQWEEELKHDKDRDTDQKILDLYNADSEKVWTKFMLGTDGKALNKKAVIPSVCSSLNFYYKSQEFGIDGAFVCGEDLYRSNLSYAQCFSVLVEHENSKDEETEMWRLLFCRSRLKVSIFYKRLNDNDEVLINEKLAKFAKMKCKASEAFAENPDTEYLFIVGNRAKATDLPEWEYYLLNNAATAVEPI